MGVVSVEENELGETGSGLCPEANENGIKTIGMVKAPGCQRV